MNDLFNRHVLNRIFSFGKNRTYRTEVQIFQALAPVRRVSFKLKRVLFRDALLDSYVSTHRKVLIAVHSLHVWL